MYIHEAVSLAMAKGKFIRRAAPEGWDSVTVDPTNDPDGLILHVTAENDPSRTSSTLILAQGGTNDKRKARKPRLWDNPANSYPETR